MSKEPLTEEMERVAARTLFNLVLLLEHKIRDGLRLSTAGGMIGLFESDGESVLLADSIQDLLLAIGREEVAKQKASS